MASRPVFDTAGLFDPLLAGGAGELFGAVTAFDPTLFDTGEAVATPLYLGADGESVVRLGTRTPAALYLGARSLF